MKYAPTAIPSDAPANTRSWLADQLRQIANFLSAPQVQYITLDVLHAAPARSTDGMIVVADGTDWNPGSGAGVYARVSGSWVKL